MAGRTGLMDLVVAAIARRGHANVDELQADLPGYPRKRIFAALYNARAARRVMIAKKGSFRAKTLSVWVIGAHQGTKKIAKVSQPIASVWELGTPRAIPMPQASGRIFNLLRDWN